MNDEITNKLSQIFNIVFELSDDVDVSKIRQISLPKWDSLSTVTLTTAIESEFGVKFDIKEAERITSYQATLLLLQEKLG